PEVPLGAAGAGLRRPQGLGRAAGAREPEPAGDGRQRAGAGPGGEGGGGGQRRPRRFREDRRLGAAARRVHPGDRRADADPEGEAPRHQSEVRRGHRPAVRGGGQARGVDVFLAPSPKGEGETRSKKREVSVPSIFRLEVGADRLATLTFDSPEKKVNVFTRAAFQELEEVIQEVAARRDIGCLILLSGKAGSFIAGAD